MRLNYFLIPALLSCFFIFSAPLMANAENAAWQHQATTYYDNGDYDKAYKAYLKLSKQGDRFSAYRVSYMMLKGQGTKPNVIESFAWAAVAAENGPTELKEYRDAVATLVPEKKRAKAQQRVGYFMRRWGPEDDSAKGGSRGNCTGSRLSAVCDGPSSSQQWIKWRNDVPEEAVIFENIEALNEEITSNPSRLQTTATKG